MLQQLGLIDPTLKSFSFVSNSEEQQALLRQAETVVEGHAVAAASDLYQKKGENDREVTAEDHGDDIVRKLQKLRKNSMQKDVSMIPC